MNKFSSQNKLILINVIMLCLLLSGVACDDDDDSQVIDEVQVQESLVDGTWRVTYFFDEKDETSDYEGYVFTFGANGTTTVTKNSTPVFGTWIAGKSISGTVELILGFGLTSALEELAQDWTIIESSDVRMKMQHVSNSGTGDTETLILEKN